MATATARALRATRCECPPVNLSRSSMVDAKVESVLACVSERVATRRSTWPSRAWSRDLIPPTRPPTRTKMANRSSHPGPAEPTPMNHGAAMSPAASPVIAPPVAPKRTAPASTGRYIRWAAGPARRPSTMRKAIAAARDVATVTRISAPRSPDGARARSTRCSSRGVCSGVAGLLPEESHQGAGFENACPVPRMEVGRTADAS
jgi:hypothetical protein